MSITNRWMSGPLVAAVLAVPASAWAQTYYPQYAPAPPVAAPVQGFTDAQLDQLLGPVALYPDPLLAQLLPAATFPLEIVSAAQWLRDVPAPTEDAINAQNWDASVKALAHYPTIIADMANRIDDTQALGAAFVNQPDDVMRSIQRLRAEAQLSGALANSPQETVAVADNQIEILPADPQVIYVPVYDPGVVYVRGGRPLHDAIRFGDRLPNGQWLNHDFDWKNRHVVVGRANDRHDAGPPPQRWVRDEHKPAPVVPRTYQQPSPPPEHRGYAPTPARAPQVYTPDERRSDVEQAVQRAQHSRPNIIPVTPAPRPQPVPVQPPHPAAPPHVEPPHPVAPPHADAPRPPGPSGPGPSSPAGPSGPGREPGGRDPGGRDGHR